MTKISLNLKDNSFKVLEKLSKEQKITEDKLCEMIIDAWTSFGGRIWSGDYKNSRAFIIDWPVRRKLIKLENE